MAKPSTPRKKKSAQPRVRINNRSVQRVATRASGTSVQQGTGTDQGPASGTTQHPPAEPVAGAILTADDLVVINALAGAGKTVAKSQYSRQLAALYGSASTEEMLRGHVAGTPALTGIDVETSIANTREVIALFGLYDRSMESQDRIAQAIRMRMPQVRRDATQLAHLAELAPADSPFKAAAAGFVAQRQVILGTVKAGTTKRRKKAAKAAKAAAPTAGTQVTAPQPSGVDQGPARPTTTGNGTTRTGG